MTARVALYPGAQVRNEDFQDSRLGSAERAVFDAAVGNVPSGNFLTPPGFVEALNQRRMRILAAPREYPDELRERAIHLVLEAREGPATTL